MDKFPDRPGNVLSIPRDVKSHDTDSPEVIWNRKSGNKITGVPDEDKPFDWPVNLNSIPRDRQPADTSEDGILDSARLPDMLEAPDDADDVFDRPGDMRSIPRDILKYFDNLTHYNMTIIYVMYDVSIFPSICHGDWQVLGHGQSNHQTGCSNGQVRLMLACRGTFMLVCGAIAPNGASILSFPVFLP
jgi:hypothetical protein